MLSQWVWTCVKKIGVTVALLLILIACVSGVSRVMSPFAKYARSLVEHILTKNLNHPVHIQTFKVKWAGLEPVISVQHVSIGNGHEQSSMLKVGRLVFQVDLWHSLKYFCVLPDHLIIDDVHVKLIQQANKAWQLLGVNSFQLNKQTSLGEIKAIFYWLATQTNVVMRKVAVDAQFYQGHLVYFKNMSLAVRNAHKQHEIITTGLIKTKEAFHPFRFVLKPTRVSEDPSQFAASFYIDLPKVEFAPWLKQTLFPENYYSFASSVDSINAEIWGEISGNQVVEFRAKLKGKNINLKNLKSNHSFLIESIAFNAYWQRENQGWHLTLDDFDARALKGMQQTHYVVINANKKKSTYSLHTDVVSISLLLSVLKISPFWNERLADFLMNTNPQGQLFQVNMTGCNYVEKCEQFDFQANFSELSMQPYASYPGVNKLSGKVSFNQVQGEVSLEGHDAQINYPFLFHAPLFFSKLGAHLQWHHTQMQGWQWNFQSLTFDDNNLVFSGSANLSQLSARSPVLELSGEFNAQEVSQLKKYIPLKGVSPKLHDWLSEAFKRGQVTQGKIKLKGGLNDPKQRPNLEVSFLVNDLTFHYAPGWPAVCHLNASLSFDNHRMVVKSHFAQIAGSTLTQVKAKIVDLADPVLSLEINSPVSLQGGLNFLSASPLEIGSAMKGWRGRGEVLLNLKMINPLARTQENLSVNGKIKFKDNEVAVLSTLPPFKHVTGGLAFNNEALSSQGVSAELMGQAVSAVISTQPMSNSSPVINFDIHGNVDASVLKKNKKLMFPLIESIDGSAAYHATLKIKYEVNHLLADFKLTSELKGMSSTLPYPFSKPSGTALPFKFELHFSEDGLLRFKVKCNELLSYIGYYQFVQDKLKLLSGSLHLGAGEVINEKEPGLFVDGFLPEFDWGEWKKFTKGFLKVGEKNANRFPMGVNAVQLEIKKLKFPSVSFGNTYLNFFEKKENYKISIQNQKITGVAFIPKKSIDPWRINIKKLNLILKSRKKTADTHLDPRSLPPIKLSCEHCAYNNNMLGKVVLETSKTNRGLTINTLEVNSENYFFKTKGSWLCEKGACVTDLSGYFSSYDLGKFLNGWGVSQAVSKGYGESMFSLTWAGSPFHVNWANLTGRLTFHYSAGRIVKLSEQTEHKLGLGRFLNILSLQSLPQNLLTGFSHLGQKGFEFDSLTGELSITNGVGKTNGVKLEGPLAWVSLDGIINFADECYNLSLSVTPNVTSSLPLIVGIAGGPVAGALTWVANKLLAPKIGQVAETEYHVKGSMHAPTITIAKQ